jgi:ribose 5-phosphate isomerase RpiB
MGATGKRVMSGPVIALAADLAGFELKNSMKLVLDEQSFPFVDLGPETADPVDYPDAANRYPWIRAAVCHDVTRRVGRASITTPTFLPLAHP